MVPKPKKGERELVNRLVKVLRDDPARAYIHVDRDSGALRHTSSGWDFLISTGGRVVFCEAKMGKGKLTEWQEYTRSGISHVGTPFAVIRFSADGLFFTINGGLPLEILRAKIDDFL